MQIHPYPNALRSLIKHAGYSFREVSKETNIPERTLYDWATGKRAIPHRDRCMLARLLECSLEELAPYSSSQCMMQLPENDDRSKEKQEDMNKKRRDLLHLLSIASSAFMLSLSAIDQDKMDKILATSKFLDGTVLRDLEAINRYYWSIYHVAPSKVMVLDGVLGQLKILISLLKETHNVSARRGLGVLASDIAQLAGEVFFDNDDYATAQLCYTFAVTIAKEAGHYDLWACALLRNAFLPIYDKYYADAFPLIEEANRIVTRGDTALATRYWIAAVSAEAYAGDGNITACQRTLEFAAEVCDMRNGANGGWLRFDGTRLPELRGACFVHLNQPDLAIPALEEALALQSILIRRRGMILNDLAHAHLLRRDIEQACTYAHEAVEIASQGSSSMLKKGLYALQMKLEPFAATDAVKQLKQHLGIL